MKIETQKIRKKYNRNSMFYDFVELPMELILGKRRMELVGNLEGNILEIGVGTGKNLKYYGPKANVIGIDLSDKMLSHAFKKLNRLGKDYSLMVMDAENLDFKNDTFDYLVCTYVLCSIPNPITALEEMKRVVNPTGKILMLEHMLSKNSLIAFFENALNPFTHGLFGFNINRDTIQSIYKSGLKLTEKENIAMYDVVKRLVAIK